MIISNNDLTKKKNETKEVMTVVAMCFLLGLSNTREARSSAHKTHTHKYMTTKIQNLAQNRTVTKTIE